MVRRTRRAAAQMAAGLLLALAAVGADSAAAQSAAGNPVPPPSANYAYFGAFVSSNTGDTLEEREELIFGVGQRKFAIARAYRSFYQASGSGVVTSTHESWRDGGRAVFLTIKPQESNGSPCNGDSNTATSCWADITAGHLDATIDDIGNELEAFGGVNAKPILVAFHHEPELGMGVSPLAWCVSTFGSCAEYKTAAQRFVNRVEAAGATNVSWVFNVTGGESRFDETKELYPGDGYVDWYGIDQYNRGGCNGSTDPWKWFDNPSGDPDQEWGKRPYDDWVNSTEPVGGDSNPDTWHASKPIMLAEWGSNEVDDITSWPSGTTAFHNELKYRQFYPSGWFLSDGTVGRSVGSAITSGDYPDLRALVYFDAANEGSTGCKWNVDSLDGAGSMTALDGFEFLGENYRFTGMVPGL